MARVVSHRAICPGRTARTSLGLASRSTIEELRQTLVAFKEACSREWLIERLGYRSPAQVRQAFAVRLAA